MHYRPGIEVVPGFRLQKMLGRGGFGEVWQAEGPGRVLAAVKIIDKIEEKAGRKEFRALKLIKDIRHPNLVSITGFWLKDAEGNLLDPEVYIDESKTTDIRPSELVVAMDLCEKSLLDRLDECRKGLSDDTPGGIPQDELLEYMEAASKAIDYLNTRHQIQHRDIKPHNIMIVGGSAKVCDFGLASTVSTARTSMGGAGSLAYMAPEVYSTKMPGPATDQYSLAITYCELRTGRLPLSDVESFAVLDDAKRKGILDLSLLDEREREAIRRATSLDSATRFATCYDMVLELRRAISGPGTASLPHPAEPIAGYQLERNLRSRDGEEIWDAVDPDGLRILLIVRDLQETPWTAGWKTLSAVRELSRSHPQLAEVYEVVCLSATGRTLPPRLFDLPNPPLPAKTLLAGRRAPRNLSERMSSGGMPGRRVLTSIAQLAEALDFLNTPQHNIAGKKVGVQHANLRPINFLADGDNVLLSNFASAQILPSDDEAFPLGKEFGDSAYTPPEFLTGRITRWSDQYMLAVAYLQLRTGRPSASLTGSTGSGPKPFGGSRLDLSELKPPERAVLERATQVDPRKRFATCREFAAALSTAWDEIQAAEAPAKPPEAPASDKTKQSARGSAGDAAATLLSPDVTNLSDTSKTAVFDPRGNATMVPSAIETRLPHDTNREATGAASTAPSKPVTAARPSRAMPPPATKSRMPLIVVGVAAAVVLAVAIPIVRNLLKDDQGKVVVKTPLGDEIQKLITSGDLANAESRLLASRGELGDDFDTLRDRLIDATTSQFTAAAKQAAERGDLAALATASNDAQKAIAKFAEATRVHVAAADTTQALVAAIKKQFSTGNAEKPDVERSLKAINAGQALLAKAQRAEEAQRKTLANELALLAGRGYARVGDWNKASAALATVSASSLGDRDLAAFDVIRALGASNGQRGGDLKAIKARRESKLDPWERQTLDGRIIAAVSGEAEKLDERWNAFHADIVKLLAGDAKSIDQARAKLDALPQSDPALWKHVSEVRSLRDLYGAAKIRATLQTDGLPADQYVKAVEELNDRVVLGQVANQSGELCSAALLRSLAVEARLTYTEPAKTEAARQLVELARTVATAAMKLSPPPGEPLPATLGKLDEQRRRLAAGQLRKLRDSADFAALRAYASGVKDILASAAAENALRAACVVECNLIENQPTSAADREALRSAQSQAASADRPYVKFVAALSSGGTLATDLAASANQLCDALADGQSGDWRKAKKRLALVVARLDAAARKQATGDIDGLSDYFPLPQPAKNTARWLDAADAFLRDAADLLPADRADEMRTIRALAKHYAAPRSADAAKAVVAQFGAPPTSPAKPRPLQSSLVLARAHVVLKNIPSAVLAYAQVYDAARPRVSAKAPATLRVELIDEYLLQPATELVLSSKASFQSAHAPKDVQAAAAKLLAARGRFAHLYPAVRARVRRQFADAKDNRSVAQAAYEWFDVAVALDPTRAEYFYGRGFTCDLRNDLSYEERAKKMRADAVLCLEPGRQTADYPGAHGLTALADYYESLNTGNFGRKRELLAHADETYAKAIKRCEEMSVKASPSNGDLAVDRDIFLVGRGFVLLHLANYATDGATQRLYLDAAMKLARQAIGGEQAGPSSRLSGAQPDVAYQLAGNTLEDYGLLLGEWERYADAIKEFDQAVATATELRDDFAVALSKYHRGRCRMRLGLAYMQTRGDLYLPAEGDTAAEKNRKEAAAARLTELAAAAYQAAFDDLSAFIESGDKATSQLAEAYVFRGDVVMAQTAAGLGGDEQAAWKDYSEASSAVERTSFSAIERAEIKLNRAKLAMQLALRERARESGGAKKWFDEGRKLAQDLAKEATDNSSLLGRALEYEALILQTQASNPADGTYGDQISGVKADIERALDAAVVAYKKSGSEEDLVAGLAHRAEHRVYYAMKDRRAKGVVDYPLLLLAARDYAAAFASDPPLNPDVLGWLNWYSFVARNLASMKEGHPAKAGFDADKAALLAPLGRAVKDFGLKYNSRLGRADRAFQLALVSNCLDNVGAALDVAKLVESEKIAIASAAKTARAEVDRWWRDEK